MLTDFEFFIATLPDWDGKDRVKELEELVQADTVVFDKSEGGYYGNYSSKWVRRVISQVFRGGTDIIFSGKQGIGKSNLIRYLFPFEFTVMPNSPTEERLIANHVGIHEVEKLSNVPTEYSGGLICFLGNIDLSYTQIDIEQLYAQVLAEQKK